MDSQQQHQCSSSLDDCLKLLRNERDDLATLRTVYDAVGIRFLDRMFRTAMWKAGDDNPDAYLQLSVTLLATFCRIPEIASSQEMVSKIPFILEFMSESTLLVSQESLLVLQECYEYLYLVMTSCERGSMAFYNFGGLKVLASHMPNFPDGSRIMELAMKTAHSLLSKLRRDINFDGYSSELLIVVTTIARQFALLHKKLKFEVLQILSDIISSESVHDALQAVEGNDYSIYIHVGVISVLQDCSLDEKFHALILAEEMVSIFGERWLISQETLPDLQENYIQSDKSLLPVLVSSGIEIDVLLNELARVKRGDSANITSMTREDIIEKQHNVAVLFSLVENVIKLISNKEELVSESTIITVINGLDETIHVVLNYLEDAKEHGENKGYDLLACVRFVGRCLAEAPHACKDKVKELLDYLLTIEGEDEEAPFYSQCFLLPMLCQLSM